jgi:hypothetical protein
LAYIFDLIDVKQKDDKPAASLKARFSQSFTSLKLGGISIDSALQVSFMLCVLLGCYHAVVQEFCLGRHPLNEASLQTVVNQCVNFNKDPFLGPMDKDGKSYEIHRQMLPALPPEMARMYMKHLRPNHLTIILAVGKRHYRRIKTSVCFAMTPLVMLTTRAVIAPFLKTRLQIGKADRFQQSRHRISSHRSTYRQHHQACLDSSSCL